MKQIETFNSVFDALGETMKQECDWAAKGYLARMQEMDEARDTKLGQQSTIIENVEKQIVNSIKGGR